MTQFPALFRFDTLPAEALRVIAGANEGDDIGAVEAAVPGDTYRMRGTVSGARLAIADDPTGLGACVADGSDLGTPGMPIEIVDCHNLMGPLGDLIDVLILRVGTPAEARIHLLPLAALSPGTDYELVGSETAAAPRRFADVASVSFLAGTHVTRADGQQIPVEEIAVGDRLLTRNNGAQAVRWIGQDVRRATGAAAPVRITKGTLNAARDLRLSPQHRLFIWQRRDEIGVGRAEVMVKAEALINGTTVRREAGGHIESYQLVFDSHEIIYAEGIAVESLLVTAQTRPLLPQTLDLKDGATHAPQAAQLEVDERRLEGPDAAERLGRASRGED